MFLISWIEACGVCVNDDCDAMESYSDTRGTLANAEALADTVAGDGAMEIRIEDLSDMV